MIFGKYTIAELRDLLKAKDYSVKQLTDSFSAFSPAWGTLDNDGMQKFFLDLTALQTRYAKARLAASAAIALSDGTQVVSDTLVPADVEYRGILRSLQKIPLTVSPGDLADLDERLRKAGQTTDYAAMPQPSPGSDADFMAYRLADTTIRDVIEPSGRAVGQAAGSVVSAIPWPVWVAGAGIVGVLLFGSLKR